MIVFLAFLMIKKSGVFYEQTGLFVQLGD